MATVTKEMAEELITNMRDWQKVENAAVSSTARIMEDSDNPIVRLVMEIIQKEENGIVSIEIIGRLDADSSPEAEKVVKDAIKAQTTRILFNLASVEYLSSAGLRVLLGAAKEMRRRDGKIVLCSLNEFVKEIFEVSGFQSLIPIADTVESGIELLSLHIIII